MTQALFGERFVKFRSPGLEKVRMVDSLFGKIAEGWGLAAFAEVLSDLGSTSLQKMELARKSLKKEA
jgi:type I restriction enzyme S subunit